MANIVISNDYQSQIDARLQELKLQYNQVFTSIFDPTVGSFVLVSENNQYRIPFYPSTNSLIYYPPYTPSQSEPANFPPASPGNGILRIEHVGLPDGYFPTTIIDGAIGTDFGPRINMYGLSIEASNAARIHLVNANQRVVQVELPMGGVDKIGYHISTQQLVGTPFGNFVYSSPWEGTAGGGQLLFDPTPGVGHTVKIRWMQVSDNDNNLVTTLPPVTKNNVPPATLPPVVNIPPSVRKELDRYATIIQSSGLTPTFIPSTMVRPTAPPPRTNPDVRLISIIPDPDNTFRASMVDQMYSYSPVARSYEWTYDVGKSPSIQPLQYKFKNNTVNTTLRFQFELPGWATMDRPRIINIPPNSEISIQVQFNEQYAKDHSIMNQRTFLDVLKWFVTPMSVVGPVYVLKNQMPLISHNPPPKQDPDTNGSQLPISINVDGTTTLLEDASRIYVTITPPRMTMVRGETFPVKLTGWIGPDVDIPSDKNSKSLTFPSNGIVWTSKSPSIATINSPNGSTNATIEAHNGGIVEFTADIIAPPSNIPSQIWQQAYVNKVSGVNVQRNSINNFPGIRVTSMVTIVTSELQLR